MATPYGAPQSSFPPQVRALLIKAGVSNLPVSTIAELQNPAVSMDRAKELIMQAVQAQLFSL